MALIKCPECSNQVSAQASSCPKCGHPLNKEEVMYHTVVWTGSVYAMGDDELNKLKADGWREIRRREVDTWVNSDGYECTEYEYELRKP